MGPRWENIQSGRSPCAARAVAAAGVGRGPAFLPWPGAGLPTAAAAWRRRWRTHSSGFLSRHNRQPWQARRRRQPSGLICDGRPGHRPFGVGALTLERGLGTRVSNERCHPPVVQGRRGARQRSTSAPQRSASWWSSSWTNHTAHSEGAAWWRRTRGHWRREIWSSSGTRGAWANKHHTGQLGHRRCGAKRWSATCSPRGAFMHTHKQRGYGRLLGQWVEWLNLVVCLVVIAARDASDELCESTDVCVKLFLQSKYVVCVPKPGAWEHVTPDHALIAPSREREQTKVAPIVNELTCSVMMQH